MAELADLLTGPTARHALAYRDIAAVFRILRGSGISQASIALATGQRESEVSEILSGRRVQSIAVLERIADGLGVSRGWMGLAYAPDIAPTQQHAKTEDTGDDNLLRHAATLLCGQPVFGVADPVCIQRAA
jgi:transcriptional regulator with XRE-family HTH domain